MRKINLITALAIIISIFSCTKEKLLPKGSSSNATYEEIQSNGGQTGDQYVLMEEAPTTDPTGDDDDEYILMEEVVDASSTPFLGAEVTLTGIGVSITGFTDVHGKCALSTSKKGDYHLEVSYQGTVYISTTITIQYDTTYRTDMLPL